MNLRVSDELLARIKDRNELRWFVLNNAFHNNARWFNRARFRVLKK